MSLGWRLGGLLGEYSLLDLFHFKDPVLLRLQWGMARPFLSLPGLRSAKQLPLWPTVPLTQLAQAHSQVLGCALAVL